MNKIKPFYMLDIETLATARDANGSSHIAMPNFSFVFADEYAQLHVMYGRLPVQYQINLGAVVGASTLAFWMREAADGNAAADEIVRALEGDEDASYSVVVSPNEETGEYSIMSSRAGFPEVIMREFYSFYTYFGSYPVLGNGPEFDNVIFDASYRKIMKHTDIPDTPWPYWASGSARTYKEMAIEKGIYVKAIQEQSAETATGLLDRINLETGTNLCTSKHDPAFDAIAEALTVLAIKEKI